jgi:hypothetical protein
MMKPDLRRDMRREFQTTVLMGYNLMMRTLYKTWHTNDHDEVRLAALAVISDHICRRSAEAMLRAKVEKRRKKAVAG